MADERALHDKVARADDAQRVLGNRVYQDAWAEYERSLVAAWRATGVDQASERETLWMALQVLAKVRSQIDNVLATGQIAAAQLKDLYERNHRD